ncbi:MAG: response regulator [Lacipirellulaceae bacterium]
MVYLHNNTITSDSLEGRMNHPSDSFQATSVTPLRYSAIYVIDRDASQYEQVDSGMSDGDVKLQVFNTATEALRIPRYAAPLCFIVNADLPDLSGFELRSMLVDRWPGVPGYVISDRYAPENEIKARCSGATLYFCKPLQPGWLAELCQPRLPTNMIPDSPHPSTSVTGEVPME